jgi:GNAT superfamily N-acetyltransferase
MTVPAWHEEAITRAHDRGAFDCGDAALNEFLRRYARQGHDQGAAKTFLAVADDTRAILGFYSLAPASLAYDRAPAVIRRSLARHEVPGFRLARIAVHRTQQGQGLGGQLLLAAGKRCLQVAAVVGGTIMIIDAKDDRAAAWYASYGAMPLLDAARTLVLPLAIIAGLLTEVKPYTSQP